ncbi:hypothetical protein DYB31_001774 [Aphanomyces astaci]|uniref:Uncharacterized protein n=1 Tax=Aphanomyces astaci TaxID=112090 RepID=A0A397FW39_APHAT|nr:hypothetical protein DYB31_001774 [Aphanomyces astaci]
MKARTKAMPLDDQPTFFEKELIDLITDETSAWTKFLQPEFGTWSEGIKRASLDAIAPLPIDPYKEMTLDERRIWLSWLENVFRMLNVKIREAEDDEVYTWYLESYTGVAPSIKNESVTPSRRSSVQSSIGPNLTVGNLDGSKVSNISHSNSANLSTASNVKTYTLEVLVTSSTNSDCPQANNTSLKGFLMD